MPAIDKLTSFETILYNIMMANNFLQNAISVFLNYKKMGEKTIEQLNDNELYYQPNEESNSIAIIMQHLWGNMKSRWTDFLTTDGEKPWRERDAEFENGNLTKQKLLEKWDEGWACLLNALDSLQPEDLEKTITIRGEAHTVIAAIHRQIAHYAYHIGQMVYIAKIVKNTDWQTLSIPRKKATHP